jgi:hypothetical protein
LFHHFVLVAERFSSAARRRDCVIERRRVRRVGLKEMVRAELLPIALSTLQVLLITTGPLKNQFPLGKGSRELHASVYAAGRNDELYFSVFFYKVNNR